MNLRYQLPRPEQAGARCRVEHEESGARPRVSARREIHRVSSGSGSGTNELRADVVAERSSLLRREQWKRPPN